MDGQGLDLERLDPALTESRGGMPGSVRLESAHVQLGCAYVTWYLPIPSFLKIISIEWKYHNLCI